ncbi:DUF2513 domain-containing protein [Pseudomonas kribbensis]|uniref:DUF2513 domain-containing protein n=1 Tax=Pseudomonas kribbensis TaxID=1628086 RepID=UPI001F23C1F6|nr:DUF2513 domain-containing protein [Pseudomonas kribbensis]UIN53599.1 DUF2513 domain-containing protein [Pseudomonas kribbensis]
MKRRLAHIQVLLGIVEDQADNFGLKNKVLLSECLKSPTGQFAEAEQIDYALYLCLEQGYLKSVKLTSNLDPGVQLTWAGHDYLEANR